MPAESASGPRLRRLRRRATPRAAAALLALGAGAVVLWLAVDLFPYGSVNHDEGVYRQQADLLLSGRLDVTPREPGAVRPWFFIRDGGRLYPRYAPVTAAVFALGELAGSARLALAAVAAGNVGLTYALASAAYDRRVGLLAAGLLGATPAFLFTAAVFLPYAPATLLNLAFAVAYVRSVRRDGRAAVAWGVVAGVAVGLAGFARPYTAMLFAAPFVLHAAWRLVRAGRRASRADRSTVTPGPDPAATVARLTAVAVPALALVGVALWYNALMTGSSWRFPFEVFAPRDGLGFGRRRVLDHAVDYTPRLALRSTAVLLWELGTRWTVAPPLGTLAALAGVGQFLFGRDDGVRDRLAVERLDGAGVCPLLVGVAVSVVVGNGYFWGTYNVLGDLADPTDGFVAAFGPFYHFDLLPVLATFGAAGALAGWRWLRARAPSWSVPRRAALGAVLALVVVAGGAAQAVALAGPYADHAAYTDRYAETYEPLDREFDDAVVFVPSTYGPWLNHPFQSLRNRAGADGRLTGDAVYARDRDPAGDFAVLDAYDRRPYRFTYRGEWTPDPADRVEPRLVPLSTRSGAAVTVTTTVAVPERADAVTARLTVDSESVARTVSLAETAPDEVTLVWRLSNDDAGGGSARIVAVRAGDRRVEVPGSLALDGPREVAATLTFPTTGGSTLTYREELDARPLGDDVQVLWPPERSVCPLVTDCGLTGTYLPDRPDPRLPGTAMRSTITAEDQ
ncbi:hypothetical protein BRD18_04900 [Halobacteriales archaeon SW_7_71_33]|nr:MAG: hypothetical protein BRD18_04900 [Halobacteriales archaeon SW_7_71_33]